MSNQKDKCVIGGSEDAVRGLCRQSRHDGDETYKEF